MTLVTTAFSDDFPRRISSNRTSLYSYIWGPAETNYRIFNSDGRRFSVTRNRFVALHEVREQFGAQYEVCGLAKGRQGILYMGRSDLYRPAEYQRAEHVSAIDGSYIPASFSYHDRLWWRNMLLRKASFLQYSLAHLDAYIHTNKKNIPSRQT